MTSIAFASHLFADMETCSEVIRSVQGFGEERKRWAARHRIHLGWTFCKLSLCGAPRELAMGPSFLQHLDFQAISSSLRFFGGSARWGMYSPLVCVFCTFSAQQSRTTSSFRVWSSAVWVRLPLQWGELLGVYTFDLISVCLGSCAKACQGPEHGKLPLPPAPISSSSHSLPFLTLQVALSSWSLQPVHPVAQASLSAL